MSGPSTEHFGQAESEGFEVRAAVQVQLWVTAPLSLYEAKDDLENRLMDAVHAAFPEHEAIVLMRPFAAEGWS